MCNLKSEGGRCAYHTSVQAEQKHNARRRKNTAVKNAMVQIAEEAAVDALIVQRLKARPPSLVKIWALENFPSQPWRALLAPAEAGEKQPAKEQQAEEAEVQKLLPASVPLPKKLPAQVLQKLPTAAHKIGFPQDGEARVTDYYHNEVYHEKALQQAAPWVTQLTAEEKQSIKAYTSGVSDTLNQAFYDGQGFATLEAQDAITRQRREERGMKASTPMATTAKNLDAALAKVKLPSTPHILYRGFYPPEGASQAYAEKVFKPGASWHLPAFTSTTVAPSIAETFGEEKDGGLLMEIVTKKGAYVDELSHGGGEREHILPRHMRLRVVGVKEVMMGTKKRRIVQLIDEDELTAYEAASGEVDAWAEV